MELVLIEMRLPHSRCPRRDILYCRRKLHSKSLDSWQLGCLTCRWPMSLLVDPSRQSNLAHQIQPYVDVVKKHCRETKLEHNSVGQVVRLKGEVDDDAKVHELVHQLAPIWKSVQDSKRICSFLIVICGPKDKSHAGSARSRPGAP